MKVTFIFCGDAIKMHCFVIIKFATESKKGKEGKKEKMDVTFYALSINTRPDIPKKREQFRDTQSAII